jgi:hypothetical protein
MGMFLHIVTLTAPLFLLVLVGYALSKWGGWPKAASDALTRFVFSLAVPTLLFRMMGDFARLPSPRPELLIAFFGSCFLVFVLGRVVAHFAFRMDGVAQSIFALGGIFSNNVLLGLPLAKVTLGDESIPAVSLVLVFNALILWTLVTVSVEWSRHRAPTWRAVGRTVKGVATNPIVASIVAGTAFGFTGLTLPAMADQTLALVGQAAVPLSLIALGMGLAEYGAREGWRQSMAICVIKLAVQPAVVFLLAHALLLPPLETRVVVMLASLPVGANVYLMSRQFGVLGGPIASSLVVSTALAAVTTPIVLALSSESG